MSSKEKDSEASLPIYAPHASPKLTDVQGDDAQPQLEGASMPMLVVASMPRMAIQMAWASWWAAMGPNLGYLLSTSAIRTIQVIGPLSGILIGPIIGAFSDRSKNPWGRRRPFLLWGAILSAIALVAMGYSQDIGEALGDSGTGYPGGPSDTTATTAFALVFFTWLSVTLNVVQTPLILLVADIAGDRQTVGASLGICWSIMGSVVTAVYIEIGGAAYLSLHYFLGLLAVTMLVTVGIVCAVVKEEPHDSSRTGDWKGFQSVVKMPSTLIIYGAVMTIVSYGLTMYQSYRLWFFGVEVLNGAAEGAFFCEQDCTDTQKNFNRGFELGSNAYSIAYDGARWLYYLVLPLIANKFGAKAVLVASFFPQAILVITSFVKVFTIAVMVDVTVTVFQNTAFVLLVPTIIHVFGKNVDIGSCVGLLSSVNSIGSLISVGVGASLVETSMGYKLPVLLAGIFALVAIIGASVFLKLKMHVL